MVPAYAAAAVRGLSIALFALFIVAPSRSARAEGGPLAANCVVGTHPDDLDAWASHVAGMACDALRARGVAVGQPTSSATGAPVAFTITLDRLGNTFALLVTYEAPPGTIRRTLWAPMKELSESERVVSRFAEELTSVSPPVVYPPKSVVAFHLREPRPRKRPDRPRTWQWYLGLDAGASSFPAGDGDLTGVALGASFWVDVGRFQIATRAMAAGTVSSPENSIASYSLGVRTYLGPGATSAFFGMGPAYSKIRERAGVDIVSPGASCFLFCSPESQLGQLQGDGFTFYAEIGVTFRRLRKFPMSLVLRGEIPFYRLERTQPDFLARDETVTFTGPTSRYELPITFVFAVGF